MFFWIFPMFLLFPTCQVRVVRFYVCGPSFLPSFFFLFLLAVLFARCRQMSTWTSRVQWAMPDLNRELQSGLGNAGPQPGSSKVDWAMPDLNQGAPKRTGQCRTQSDSQLVSVSVSPLVNWIVGRSVSE